MPVPYTPDGDPDFAKLITNDTIEMRTAFLSDRGSSAFRLDRLEA